MSDWLSNEDYAKLIAHDEGYNEGRESGYQLGLRAGFELAQRVVDKVPDIKKMNHEEAIELLESFGEVNPNREIDISDESWEEA